MYGCVQDVLLLVLDVPAYACHAAVLSLHNAYIGPGCKSAARGYTEMSSVDDSDVVVWGGSHATAQQNRCVRRGGMALRIAEDNNYPFVSALHGDDGEDAEPAMSTCCSPPSAPAAVVC